VSPLLLDLFCGAGGAAMGYSRAGWEVVGVDVAPQPNYPFEFRQADALEYLAEYADCYAAVHASPPCQTHSKMSGCRPGLAEQYEDLIGPTRALLERTGLPWVIENVPGAPLRNPMMLCGFMFGYELYRHRLFESNVPLVAPEHPPHTKPGSRAGHWEPGTVISITGHCSPMRLARKVMDIDWTTRDELGEAIPPYYAEFVGHQLMAAVEGHRRYA
jgi:DNA (cytosine-5)-methyltransferase 1